jgi:hypothetical protein
MSVPQKNIQNISKLFERRNIELERPLKRKESAGKSHNSLSVKYSLYEREEKNIKTDLCILNFITNDTDRKYSVKTSLSDSNPIKYNYDLHMINKYDENFNTSLSFISEFDLEEDEEKKNNESFDSFAHDDSGLEIIEIKCSNKKVNDKLDENDDIEFEKEWNDIQNFLLNK